MSTRKKAIPAKLISAKAGKTVAKAATPQGKPAPSGQLTLDEIKSLIALVGKEPFQEFEFEAGDMKFRIRKESLNPSPQVAYASAPAASPFGSPVTRLMANAASAPELEPLPTSPAAPAAPLEDPSIHFITSPIVGTFYRASNPNSPILVQVGDGVRPGQTLCIIEAMKLMNEIESDISGEILKVLVENGQPVEYGERLFAVKVG